MSDEVTTLSIPEVDQETLRKDKDALAEVEASLGTLRADYLTRELDALRKMEAIRAEQGTRLRYLAERLGVPTQTRYEVDLEKMEIRYRSSD